MNNTDARIELALFKWSISNDFECLLAKHVKEAHIFLVFADAGTPLDEQRNQWNNQIELCKKHRDLSDTQLIFVNGQPDAWHSKEYRDDLFDELRAAHPQIRTMEISVPYDYHTKDLLVLIVEMFCEQILPSTKQEKKKDCAIQ